MTFLRVSPQPVKPVVVTRHVVARQWIGNLILVLLAFAWLQIPDSHVWQFAFSVLSALFLVAAFLWLHALTFRLERRPSSPAPIAVALLLLAAFVALWLLILWLIAACRQSEPLFAGYWNSKLSHGLRHFFTYGRLLFWQDRFYDLVQWLFAALLLPIAIETVAFGLRAQPLRRAMRVYRHWLYWILAVLCGFAGSAITAVLARWTPGRGLKAETASVILRLGVAYTLDILLWCLMLALAAHYLKRAEPDIPANDFVAS